MPKPILKAPQSQTSNISALSATQNQQNRTSATLKTDPAQIQLILRKRRSSKYLDAIKKLDAGGKTPNKKLAEEVVQAIRDEFPDLYIENILLGCMAVCNLGNPLEVHTIDVADPTIIHIPRHYPLGTALDKARSLAIMPDYLCIEIYSHELRAILRTGSVAIIEASSAEKDWKSYQSQPTIACQGCGESFM